jgi:ABC-type multidrug transport system fused ATPase/permease subunit
MIPTAVKIFSDREALIRKILIKQAKISALALLFEITSIYVIYAAWVKPEWYRAVAETFAEQLDLQGNEGMHLLDILSIAYFMIGLMVRLKSQNSQYTNTMTIETIIGKLLYRDYLNRPYEWHKSNHSSDLTRNILQDANQMASTYYFPIIQIYSNIGLVIGLLAVGVAINFTVTLIFLLFVGCLYLLTQRIFKADMARIGAAKVDVSKKRYRFIANTIGSLRNIYSNDLKDLYTKQFEDVNSMYTQLQAKYLQMSAYPMLIIEGIVLLSIIILGLSANQALLGGAQSASLMLALVLATRLLPASNRIYNGFIQIKFSSCLAQEISAKLDNPAPIERRGSGYKEILREIDFESVSYSIGEKEIISRLSFNVQAGSRLLITGASGAGKSTVLELMCGLLTPTGGKILFNDHVLDYDSAPFLRTYISYVPQKVSILETSVASNVLNSSPWDEEAYSRVDYICGLSSAGLPPDLDCGEDGVKISGGQKQRIGIARALYKKNFDVLLLDESTSALDIESENELLGRLLESCPTLTLVCISHNPANEHLFDKKVAVYGV